MTDPVRRRLLRLGTATAAASMLPRVGRGEETRAPLHLDAEAQDGSGVANPASALGYGRPAVTPVLRVRQGGVIGVHLANTLREATAIDWHGLRAAGALDAVPELGGAVVAPGGETDFTLKPTESGTSWFHPPFVPGWSNQTARGLAGVVIVEEAAPPPVDDDVVLLLADAPGLTDADGTTALRVNRADGPDTRTYPPGSRIRLRLVNGSTRRPVVLAFEGARPMVVAVDGQPSDLFRPLDDRLPAGPGARFDVLVDLPRKAGQDFRVLLDGLSAEKPATAFLARLEGAAAPDRPPITALAPNPALPPAIPLEKAKRVEITVDAAATAPSGVAFTLNGKGGTLLPKTPLFTARRASAVTVGMANRTKSLIGLRLHGQAMRQLHALDDGWEPYWRDGVLVPPGKTVHVAFWADRPGRWLIESPFFDQATTGLRRWFEII